MTKCHGEGEKNHCSNKDMEAKANRIKKHCAPWQLESQQKHRMKEGELWCVSRCAVITGFHRGKEREGPGFQG